LLAIPPSFTVEPFAPSAGMIAFAREATRGRNSPAAKARALYDALMGVMRDGRIVADRDNTPKERQPLTARELWEQSRSAGAAPLGGCYELTVLFLAMARATGLATHGAEPVSQLGSGATGHVVAVVDFGDGDQALVDLQNRVFGHGEPVRALDDAELTAHHYNHIAVAALLRGNLPSARMALNAASAIADSLPQVENNLAALAAREGQRTEAVTHARRAVSLAPGAAVYRYQYGRALIDAGELCPGLSALHVALTLEPGYQEARAVARGVLETRPELECHLGASP
jgi:hypothetical protein